MKGRFVRLSPLLVLLAIQCSTVQMRSVDAEGTAPFDDQIRVLFSSPSSVRGSGTVKMAVAGERHSAVVDVHKANGTVKASLYSSFGAPVGFFAAGSDSGVMSFQGEKRTLAIDQPLDADMFPWAENILIGDLATLLCGRLPPRFSFPRLPDERINGRGKSILVWKSDTVTLSLVFLRHSLRLKRSILEIHPRGNAGLTVTCGSFFKGTARFISLDVDDRNYFSLKYEKLQEE